MWNMDCVAHERDTLLWARSKRQTNKTSREKWNKIKTSNATVTGIEPCRTTEHGRFEDWEQQSETLKPNKTKSQQQKNIWTATRDRHVHISRSEWNQTVNEKKITLSGPHQGYHTIQLSQLARTLALSRSLAYSIPYTYTLVCGCVVIHTLVYMQYVPIQITDGNRTLNENIHKCET